MNKECTFVDDARIDIALRFLFTCRLEYNVKQPFYSKNRKSTLLMKVVSPFSLAFVYRAMLLYLKYVFKSASYSGVTIILCRFKYNWLVSCISFRKNHSCLPFSFVRYTCIVETRV